MPKQGRPVRIVNAYAELWPISKVKDLPEMRGIYILYDKHRVPLYCGRSGKGKSDARMRINGEKSERYYGPKIRYFSVYDLDRGNHHQIETLILHAMQGALRWNKRKGKFRKSAKAIPPP